MTTILNNKQAAENMQAILAYCAANEGGILHSTRGLHSVKRVAAALQDIQTRSILGADTKADALLLRIIGYEFRCPV